MPTRSVYNALHPDGYSVDFATITREYEAATMSNNISRDICEHYGVELPTDAHYNAGGMDFRNDCGEAIWSGPVSGDALYGFETDNTPRSIMIGILEISTGRLTAANAGHEYPAIRKDDGGFALYKDKHGFVLGGMENVRYREYEIQMNPGDKLFVYTDGVPEATAGSGDIFGAERMTDALNSFAEGTPEEILRTVRSAVDAFVGDAESFDDLTMKCVEYKGPQAVFS